MAGRTRQHRRGRAAILAVIAVSLVGCGDDADDDTADSGGSPTTLAASATTTAGGQASEYCAKSFAIETFMPPEVDFESLSPEQQKEENKKLAQLYVPLAEDVQRVTPADTKADVDVLVNAVKEVVRTGDFEGVFSRPEVEQAGDKSHQYDLRTCRWAKADISAVDYAFENVPANAKPGPFSFDFTNKGTEGHELALLRLKDDTKESVADLLKLPEEQGRQKVTMVNQEFAEPGKSGYVVADLKPGRYAVVCFVPVGGRDGPPHFTRGMFAEVTVS